MRLTRIFKFVVSHHRCATQQVNAASEGEAATAYATEHGLDAGDIIHIRRDADPADLYRIDPDPAPVPSFGWVPGEPPKDGQFYLVRYVDEDNGPTPGVARWDGVGFDDDNGYSYADGLITHHNPTPISLEIP